MKKIKYCLIRNMLRFERLFKKNINSILFLATSMYLITLSKIIRRNKLWNLKEVLKQEEVTFKLIQVLLIVFLFWGLSRRIKKEEIKKWAIKVGILLFASLLSLGRESIFFIYRFIGNSIDSGLNNVLEVTLLILSLGIFEINQFLKNKKRLRNSMEEIELFIEREEDLKRLKYLIEKNRVIGIDDYRGNGKTTLINKLLDNRSDLEVIKINLLNIGESEIAEVFFKELNIILSRNNSIFQNKNLAKKILKGQSVAGINLNPFIELETVSERINNFKEEIKSITKYIYVVIDDLDRTSDIEKIKKSLNIVAELSEGVENLRFIILYSQESLEKLDKELKRGYIEKYIPSPFSLSKIDFEELMLKYLKKEELDDFDFLLELHRKNPHIFKNRESNEYINKALVHFESLFSREVSWNTKEITIRKAEDFIKEVRDYFILLKKHSIEIEKRNIISYFFIKHFMYEEFKKLSKLQLNNALEDKISIVFSYKGENITLNEIAVLDFVLKKASKINVLGKFLVIYGSERKDIEKINELSKLLIGEEIFEKKQESYVRKSFSDNLVNDFRLKVSKLQPETNIKENLFVMILFDYYEYDWNSTRENVRNNENIMHTIKKLNRWATNNKSEVTELIENLKVVFKIKDINLRKKKYFELREKMYQGNVRSILYFGGNQWEELVNEFDPKRERGYCKNIIELMFYSESLLNNEILKVLSNESLYYENKELWLFVMDNFSKKDVSAKLYKPLAEKTIKSVIKFIIYNKYDVKFYERDMILYDYNFEGMEKFIESLRENLMSNYPLETIETSLRKELEIIYNFLDKAKLILNKYLTPYKDSSFRIEIKDGGLERAKEIEELKESEEVDIDKLYSKGELQPSEYAELLKIKKQKEII